MVNFELGNVKAKDIFYLDMNAEQRKTIQRPQDE